MHVPHVNPGLVEAVHDGMYMLHLVFAETPFFRALR